MLLLLMCAVVFRDSRVAVVYVCLLSRKAPRCRWTISQVDLMNLKIGANMRLISNRKGNYLKVGNNSRHTNQVGTGGWSGLVHPLACRFEKSSVHSLSSSLPPTVVPGELDHSCSHTLFIPILPFGSIGVPSAMSVSPTSTMQRHIKIDVSVVNNSRCINTMFTHRKVCKSPCLRLTFDFLGPDVSLPRLPRVRFERIIHVFSIILTCTWCTVHCIHIFFCTIPLQCSIILSYSKPTISIRHRL